MAAKAEGGRLQESWSDVTPSYHAPWIVSVRPPNTSEGNLTGGNQKIRL